MSDNGRELLAALDPLLEEALSMEPDQRETWLKTLRVERPAIALELELLLNQEARLEARGFLQARGHDLFDEVPSLAGLRLGPYTLEQPIGKGGMGIVWLARRSDGRFEGRAAVKLLNLALVDAVGTERFSREGSVLAQLTHPNVARLLDAGVTNAGQPYLVLEYVEGRRIDQYCDEHRLGPIARLALFGQALAAVAHAHAHLIVHRDLKPSNILVTADGSVKLLDFGIAKLLESEASAGQHSELTERGGLPLTPEYAAPEQVLGALITTATDVYSLGVLLYLLLAGRHPTSGGSLTTAQLLAGILDTEPPRLSTAVTGAATRKTEDVAEVAAARGTTVERLKRLYQGDLDNILAKALKKDPAQRYPTVPALADDLDRHVHHQPVQARADSVGYRARKFIRRNRLRVGTGALMVSALLAATVVTTDQMIDARRQRDAAVYERQRADAQLEFQTLLLSHVGDQPITLRQVLDSGRVLLERQYAGDPRLQITMLLQLAGGVCGHR